MNTLIFEPDPVSITVLIKPQRDRHKDGNVTQFAGLNMDLSQWVPSAGELKNIVRQVVQQPLAFMGPNNCYAVYSYFSEDKWKKIQHTLPFIERELTKIETAFGLPPGSAIDSVIFQNAKGTNAYVNPVAPKTVGIWDKVLDSFGNWTGVAWHEAAHSLDLYFKISEDENWQNFYKDTKKELPNFFLFVTESNFLVSPGGHPSDNEAELFASVMSSLTHPDLMSYLKQRAHFSSDRKYVEKFNQALLCLYEIFNRKLPVNAPILKQISDIQTGIGKILAGEPITKGTGSVLPLQPYKENR